MAFKSMGQFLEKLGSLSKEPVIFGPVICHMENLGSGGAHLL